MNTQTFPEETCKFVHKIKDSLIRQPNDKESYFYSELYVYCKVINQCLENFRISKHEASHLAEIYSTLITLLNRYVKKKNNRNVLYHWSF